jgi:hypothetical protein
VKERKKKEKEKKRLGRSDGRRGSNLLPLSIILEGGKAYEKP